MEKNIFQLDNEQLKEIARSFKAKVEEGLNTENAEIQCIPTFIAPKTTHDYRNKTGKRNANRILLFLSDRVCAKRRCKTLTLDKRS